MKIERIAFYTRDLERSAEFFEKYFGGIRNRLYHDPKTGPKSYLIHFSSGAKLELECVHTIYKKRKKRRNRRMEITKEQYRKIEKYLL